MLFFNCPSTYGKDGTPCHVGRWILWSIHPSFRTFLVADTLPCRLVCPSVRRSHFWISSGFRITAPAQTSATGLPWIRPSYISSNIPLKVLNRRTTTVINKLLNADLDWWKYVFMYFTFMTLTMQSHLLYRILLMEKMLPNFFCLLIPPKYCASACVSRKATISYGS